MTDLAPPRNARIEWIDAARGLSIVLVVLTHSIYWLRSAGIDAGLPLGIDTALADARMPVFFLSAGLVADRLVRAPWQKVVARITLLLWVMLLWQTIAILYSLLAGLHIHGQSLASVALRAAAKPLVVLFYPTSELWFLWALALMTLITRAFIVRHPRALLFGALGVSLTIAALPLPIITAAIDVAGVGWVGLPRYIGLFVLGASLGTAAARRVGEIPRPGAGILALVAGVALLALNAVDLPGLSALGIVAGVVWGVATARALDFIPTLRSVGANTLPVYVMHTLLIVLLVIIANAPLEALPTWASPLIVAAMAVAGSSLIGIWLRRSEGARWLLSAPPWLVGLTTRRLPQSSTST